MASDVAQEQADQESRRPPENLGEVRARSWGGVLKRTVTEFKQDNVTDWAAALTYYGVLSIFPAIIALVSVLGLIGPSATQPLVQNLGKLAPGPAQHIFTSAINNVQHGRATAGIVFIVGIAVAVWSASGYVAAFMRASNSIYDIEEGRPIWMTMPVRVGVTVVLLAMLAISNIGVLLGAELNAERERGRQIEAGHRPDQEPFVEPRRAPKRRRQEVGASPR